MVVHSTPARPSSALTWRCCRFTVSVTTRPELWLGGPLGMLFIASATLFVRYLGVLVFAVVSVLGQLAGALVLDILLPAPGTVVGPLLLLGLAVVALGVVLSSRQASVGRDDSEP